MIKVLFSTAIIFIIPLCNLVHAAVLVGYWDFEEAVGNAVLDQSGFGNNGTLSGASRSAGKVGSGISLNGTGGVTIPNSPSLDSLPGGFTMSAWINSTNFPDYTTIFWKTDRHNRPHMLHFQVNGSLYACMNGPDASDGPCDFEGIAPNTIGLNEWHFVAWTYDQLTHRLYDNGTEVFNASFSDPWVGNDIDLLIGFHPEITSANFHGFIDEARIYRGALTQEEILRDMNFQPREQVIPEPSTLILFGLALSGVMIKHRFYTT